LFVKHKNTTRRCEKKEEEKQLVEIDMRAEEARGFFSLFNAIHIFTPARSYCILKKLRGRKMSHVTTLFALSFLCAVALVSEKKALTF
jgi:hypothetical protein